MLCRVTVAYRVGEIHDKNGFWKFEPGKAPKLLVPGDVLSPSISSDGKWALLAMLPKNKASWAEPNVLVRVNLSSGEVLRSLCRRQTRLSRLLTFPNREGFLLIVQRTCLPIVISQWDRTIPNTG